jgi:hypothetical protein
VKGIVEAGDATDNMLIVSLDVAQAGCISRIKSATRC